MGLTDKHRGKHSFPAMAGRSTWTGIADIASGDSSVVVTATQITSGAAIITGLGMTSVASHQPLVTSVNSVVNNTSMVLQVNNPVVDNQQVYYTIIEN